MLPALVLCTLLCPAFGFGHAQAVALARRAATPGAARRSATQLAVTAVPAELSQPEWLPELTACCALSNDDGSKDSRMGAVLEWLQTMLVQLELGGTEELDGPLPEMEDDELDEDFVNTARPWLHAKAFHDIACEPAAFGEQIWSSAVAADYLAPGGVGGTVLLLLPSQIPLALFERVAATVSSSVTTYLNGKVLVTACHPDTEKVHERTPVPLLRLFLDEPDLLVEGGSMVSQLAGAFKPCLSPSHVQAPPSSQSKIATSLDLTVRGFIPGHVAE